MIVTRENIEKLKPNKNELFFSLTLVCSCLLASNIAAIVFRANFNIIVWSTIFGAFLIFFRSGKSKSKQISNIILYSIAAYILLITFAFSMTLPIGTHAIIRAIIIFLSLFIPRLFKHNKYPGTFLVVFMLIFMLLNNLDISSKTMLFSVYSDLLIGITIGLLCTIFFLANFPYISVISAPKESSIKKGKHAFRLTICLNIAFIVSSYIPTTNIVWICLAILTVSSTTIGDSVQRAISRIAGTLIGGIIGAIIANNLFKIYPTSLYLCYPLIFISFLYKRSNQAFAIGVMTIVVAATFFFFARDITPNEFIISRIYDTFIGVFIGLLGEMIIFPSSILPQIRKTTHELFSSLSKVTKYIAHPDQDHKIKNLIEDQNAIMKEIKSEINTIKYEPIIYLSKRYSYVLKIYNRLKKIHQDIKELGSVKKISQNDILICDQITKIMKFMQELSPKDPHIDDINKAINKLEKVINNKKTIGVKNQYIQQIIIDISKLLNLYKEACKTPYWIPSFK